MNFSEVSTERFILKILTPELISNEYLSWFSKDNESSNYIAYAKQTVTLDSLRLYASEKLASEEALFFGIFTKNNLKHIGNIKFEPVNFKAHYAVLGILIGDPSWRGKGVFGEINAALEEVLRSEGIKKIFLGVEKENVAAVRAYYKTGYADDLDNFLKIDLSKAHSMVKVL